MEAEVPRDLAGRRMNIVMVTQNHSENSNAKIEVLKGLSDYDFLQVQLHAGRLFIRDKIILE